MLTGLPYTLLTGFTAFVQMLHRVVSEGLRRNPLPVPVVCRIANRINRLRDRFLDLLARFEAGTLPPLAVRPGPAGPARADAPPRPQQPPGLAARGIAALIRPVPEAAQCRGWLWMVLTGHPELRPLLSAAPQAGRILRPLCRMLDVEPPPELALPRRPRVRKPRPAPARQKPVDVTRLSRLAFADIIHPEREPMGCRPPNRIGYARPQPPPKDWAGRFKKLD